MSAIVGGGVGVKDLLSWMVRWRVAGRWYLAALSPLAFFAISAVAMAASGRGWPDLGELGKFSGLPVVAAPVMWGFLLVIACGPRLTTARQEQRVDCRRRRPCGKAASPQPRRRPLDPKGVALFHQRKTRWKHPDVVPDRKPATLGDTRFIT